MDVNYSLLQNSLLDYSWLKRRTNGNARTKDYKGETNHKIALKNYQWSVRSEVGDLIDSDPKQS